MDDYNISDDESTGSWSDESNIDDLIYEAEELSNTKYSIVLCEKFNNLRHGKSNEANNHYLVHIRLKTLDMNYINHIKSINPRIRLEIGECLYLPSQHCVSIIKTYWLRLIQRTWKKIYKEQKNIIKKRCNPNSIKYREIYGKWPDNCRSLPCLKGMLSQV